MRTAIIQLGKFGDICNILPLVKHFHDRDGIKPVVFVYPECQSIFDGVSYVDVGIVQASASISALTRRLLRSFDQVFNMTVGGYRMTCIKTQSSFAKEQWSMAGSLHLWRSCGPMVFDQRNKERERKLVMTYASSGPNILVNLSGVSSPLPAAQWLWNELRRRFSRYCSFINLAAVDACRFYDLLGLYDHADGLISIDTGTLHLAVASNISTFGLIAEGWGGSETYKPCDYELRYNEVQSKAGQIFTWIESILERRGIRYNPTVAYLGNEKVRAMRETSKAMRRRHLEHARGDFRWLDILTGKGIDIGTGNDPLQIPGCVPFDMYDGDAQFLDRYIPAGSLDYIHASHVLEHLRDPITALRCWARCLKPKGRIIATVPEWDIFEKRHWPSKIDPDHKHAWSQWRKADPLCPELINVPEFIKVLGDQFCIYGTHRFIDTHYDYSMPDDVDQCYPEDGAEASIEMVFKIKV